MVLTESKQIFQIDHQLGSLLQTDKALSKEEKKGEKLKREVEMKKEENALLDRQKTELQQHQEKLRKTYEANLRRQQEEVMQQHQQDMEILQKKMTKESEERERLVAEGFKQQADMMRDQLVATQVSMEEKEERNREQQMEMMETFTEQMNALNERSNLQLKELIAQMSQTSAPCSIQ